MQSVDKWMARISATVVERADVLVVTIHDKGTTRVRSGDVGRMTLQWVDDDWNVGTYRPRSRWADPALSAWIGRCKGGVYLSAALVHEARAALTRHNRETP